MTLTIEQKADAVAVAHERLLAERPGWATLAEVLGDREAKEKLARIDRGLERLAAEARRLAAERRGGGAGPPEAASRAAMEAHTRKIEDGFHQDLARLGHAGDHTPAVRRQIEAEALGYVRETYGEHAAEHCRKLLAPLPLEGAAGEPGSPLDGLRSVRSMPA